MVDGICVANNVKELREANGYTQKQLAEFLNIGRSAYANYEAGEREFPLSVLEKLADLFGCELYSLYSENDDIRKCILATAFRVDNLSAKDMQQVAAFKHFVMNYLKMDNLLAR